MALGALVYFMVPSIPKDIPQMAVFFALPWVVCLSFVWRQQGLYRPVSAYLLLFGFFHGGLLLSVGLRGSDGIAEYDDTWIYGGHTPRAVGLAVLGMVVLTIVAELSRPRGVSSAIDRNCSVATKRGPLGIVGLAALSLGLAVFAAGVVAAGGLALLAGGYQAYINGNAGNEALGYGTLLIGLGAVCTIAAGGRARVIGWTAFTCYSVVALLVGNRGEVLFPLVTLLVVEAGQGRRLRPHWSAAASVGILTLIGVVRQTRTAGFSSALSLGSPLDAVAEMGYSLKPTTVVLGWHAVGEPFREGRTFVAVPLRLVEALFGPDGGPPSYDDRLFNVEILNRTGPIGGSPIAEAYHNFGTVGVIFFMAVIGLALAGLERVRPTPYGHALVGAVLLPLLLQIRNSFAPVPFQLAAGIVLVGIAHIWAKTGERDVASSSRSPR